MALGFGEITPAGHIEFGCPDLVGLVGAKAPRPTQSQSRARARTHTHTRTHSHIYTSCLRIAGVTTGTAGSPACVDVPRRVPFAAVLEAVGATRWEDEPAYL